MAQVDYNVKVNVQRATRVKDTAGGKTATFANVTGLTGLTATMHLKNIFSLTRNEEGPGTQTQTKPFFKFLAPFPAVLVNDRLVLAAALELGGGTAWASGKTFEVQFVRPYARTMQVDAEIVQ